MINYAIDYGKAVDEAFGGTRYSNDLWNASANSRITFDGASHIKVQVIRVNEGRRDRTRRSLENGNYNNWSNDWEDYKLSFDREWSTLVDPRDVDDTNGVATIAKVTEVYNKFEKIPEQDRYMFSKLYKEKVEKDGADSIIQKDLNEENILQTFDSMITEMKEKRVATGLQLYVTTPVAQILKNAKDIYRTVSVDAGSQSINRIVKSLDEVEIKEVPSDLMMTDFDFEVGSELKDGAQQIEMFLIADGCHIAPDKYDFVGFQAPSALTKGNNLYYESEFSDVFLLKELTAGYQAVVAPGKGGSNNNAQQPANNAKQDDKQDTKQDASK